MHWCVKKRRNRGDEFFRSSKHSNRHMPFFFFLLLSSLPAPSSSAAFPARAQGGRLTTAQALPSPSGGAEQQRRRHCRSAGELALRRRPLEKRRAIAGVFSSSLKVSFLREKEQPKALHFCWSKLLKRSKPWCKRESGKIKGKRGCWLLFLPLFFDVDVGREERRALDVEIF